MRVGVIEKYKDKEKLLKSGVGFETSVKRANQLIREKNEKRLD